MVRKRKDSIEHYRKAEREELAEKEEQEIAIIKEYLPEQLSEEKIRAAAVKTISELGVKSPKEMGKVMGGSCQTAIGQSRWRNHQPNRKRRTSETRVMKKGK